MRSQLIITASFSFSLAVALRARQADPDNVCDNAILEHEKELNQLPSPPSGSAWENFLAQQTHMPDVTDACMIPMATGDPFMVSSYDSVVSGFTSWLTAYSDEINSFLSACHDDDMYGPMITSLNLPVESNRLCSELAFQTLASNPAEATEDATIATPSSEELTTINGSDDSEESGSASNAAESESSVAELGESGLGAVAVAIAGFAAFIIWL